MRSLLEINQPPTYYNKNVLRRLNLYVFDLLKEGPILLMCHDVLREGPILLMCHDGFQDGNCGMHLCMKKEFDVDQDFDQGWKEKKDMHLELEIKYINQ